MSIPKGCNLCDLFNENVIVSNNVALYGGLMMNSNVERAEKEMVIAHVIANLKFDWSDWRELHKMCQNNQCPWKYFSLRCCCFGQVAWSKFSAHPELNVGLVITLLKTWLPPPQKSIVYACLYEQRPEGSTLKKYKEIHTHQEHSGVFLTSWNKHPFNMAPISKV